MTVLIFDLDGTLTDSREGITRCIAHALRNLEAPVPETAELERWIGVPLHDAFAEALGSRERAAEAVACFRERYSTVGLFENAVYPGIVDALRALQERSATMFVATNKPQEYAERILDHFELTPFFRRVYGAGLRGEDKAVLVAELLEREAVRPGEAFMIGDRKHDVLAARANGVATIGVAWGFGSLDELRDAGADTICMSVADLAAHCSAVG